MGPVITPESKTRIEGLIAKGVSDGAKAVVDGRGPKVASYEKGNFLRPTVLDGVPASEFAGGDGDFWAGAELDSRGHD